MRRPTKHQTEGICPLCRVDTVLSVEHVIPWWVECLMHDLGPFYPSKNGVPATAPTPHMDITICLCETCNHRLGKKFEEPASLIMKPMIRPGTNPQTMFLLRGQQVTIARWFLKQIMFRCHIGNHAFPPVYWDWLRKGGKPAPPPGTHIWLSRYPAASQAEPVLLDAALPPTIEPRFEWVSPRVTIGEIAAYVIQQRDAFNGVATHRAEDLGVVTRIFPTQKTPIDWFSLQAVGKADLMQIESSYLVF